jgi:hypothetical protein
LLPHAVILDFDGVPVRTLDLERLLKTKRTARDKDKLDRAILERALEELKRPALGRKTSANCSIAAHGPVRASAVSGVKIDCPPSAESSDARVLDADGAPIAGL